MRRESFLCVWNLSSFGMERIDAWVETLYFVYRLSWKLPNSFLVRLEVRRTTRLLYVFLVGCKPCLRVVYECSFDFG